MVHAVEEPYDVKREQHDHFGRSPERRTDPPEHPAEIPLDLTGAEPQHPQPERLERLLPPRVGEGDVGIVVHCPVDFDDEPARQADEVDVERPDRVLPPEVSSLPIAPEHVPEPRLAGGVASA